MAISIKHKSITIDVNDRNAPNVVGIANINDKATRYLDVTLTASGEKLTFADCTVTATFATDGYLISDSVACTLNSTADVITVPLEDFKSMSGFLAIEIKIANGETQVLNTPLALKVMVTPSLAENSKISNESAGSFVEISREIATARGNHNSLGARLNGIDSSVSDKADKSTVSQLSARMQTAEKALTGKANATDVANALKSKEDNLNKVSSKTDITDSNTNYPSIGYLNEYYYDANETYSSAETDELLGNKANLVNSLNIFDFDAWVKAWQKSTTPVYHGTLDELNFDEKSFTITPTEHDTYTNSWQAKKISVKPNTKYRICWLTNNHDSNAFVFFNGKSTEGAFVVIKGGKGTFVTNNDTSFITLRFGTYGNTTFKVSKIMITEKEAMYLPSEVAEGVPEVADEILAFEKTTQTSLDSKYDGSNIELGTATLTPYSTLIDKIKSATCLYEKIGDIVIVNVTVIMNATSLGGTSAISLLNMPFSNKSDVIVHDIGISKNGGMFRGNVNKSAWLQFTPLNKQAYNFVADEQVNFSLIYKI